MKNDSKRKRRETLPVREAAERLGISLASAYAAAQRGELPCIRVGGRVLVLREGFERLLAGSTEARGAA